MIFNFEVLHRKTSRTSSPKLEQKKKKKKKNKKQMLNFTNYDRETNLKTEEGKIPRGGTAVFRNSAEETRSFEVGRNVDGGNNNERLPKEE